MEKINLAHPPDKGTLSLANPRLQWEPLRHLPGARKLRYLLVVFATRPGPAPGRRSKPLELFKSKALSRNFLNLPIREKGLQPGRTYWWRVQAINRDGQVVALSEKRSFKLKKEAQPVTEVVGELNFPGAGLYHTGQPGLVFAPSFWETLRERMVPPAPTIWGKPVRLRLREESEPEGETPEGPGGSTEPILLAWGNEAGEICLPYHQVRRASVYWDLSGIEGCHSVLLQVSGPDGFSEPPEGNVLEDANVINYYWGPPTITCGYEEIETPYGAPPAGSLVSAMDINLLDAYGSSAPTPPPTTEAPEIVRQVRTVPCDESRHPVDIASDPVTIRCARYPAVRVREVSATWSWGDRPWREIVFTVNFERSFPEVVNLRYDEETGSMVPVTAPSTLLVYTSPGPSTLTESTCAHLSLTMEGASVERRNQIVLAQGHPAADSYVIPLDPWPRESRREFRLVQEWRGGIMADSLYDFLDPRVVAAVVPGVHPSWNYCGGAAYDFDSLYGREDLPDEPTNSPLYYYQDVPEVCMPLFIIGWHAPLGTGIEQFNEFMGRTFRGTRTVVHDLSEGALAEVSLDEPEGEQEVVVRFETENPDELRFIMPTTTQPVMMRETRGASEKVWKVRYLDGVAAGLDTTDRTWNIFYSGRGVEHGRSRFDPPRMEIWLSVRVGVTSRGSHVWADIHYDLRADG